MTRYCASVTVDVMGTTTWAVIAEDEDELEEIIEEIESTGESDRATMISEEVGPDGSGAAVIRGECEDEEY